MEKRALCEQINKQTATEMQVIVHHTTGWYEQIDMRHKQKITQHRSISPFSLQFF